MPKYIISAEGCDPVTLDCPGCSGDALKIALANKGIHSFRVQKRSPDGLSYWFEVDFKREASSSSLEIICYSQLVCVNKIA
ncbi:MAG: hypothetical protein EBQ52_01535 [Synechococcaceae bacterium LLD_019]|nr:hypothetical protein [Synechococcaceae bacterium WB5_2B_268]NBY58851.1 hypothetical protein [Synechococcaceae bacterium LLD_019]NDD21246.1 hypothetical protein [Synechococcaceae bacterium WBA_3_309]NDE23081.1 hypothetical protein [Synechococcaceae bacterium WB9_3_282]